MTIADCAVFLLITVVVNGPLSPVLPAAYEPLLIYFSPLLGPLPTALLGTVGTLFVEYLNYHLHRGLLKTRTGQRITGGPLVQKVVALFKRRPAFTVWLCAWSPLPYWPVRLLSPLAGLSLSKHLTATALGRFPQYLAVIALGAQLHLSTGALGAIIVGSTLLTLGIWVIKRLLQRPAAIVSAVLVAGVLLSWGRPATAQESQPIPAGVALGLTVDRFRGEEESYATITLHVSSIKPRGVTPEFALSFFPTELAEGAVIGNIDLGAAWNLSFPGGTLLLRAGGSVLAAVGGNNALALPGFHYGASLLLRATENFGLRFDVIERRYQLFLGASTFTVGVGFSLFPHR